MGYNIEKFKEELTELRRKKEQGSIYDYDLGRLVMAECIEKLIIPDVSQQRELLIAYEIESKKPYKMSREIAEAKVTMIMKAINCG